MANEYLQRLPTTTGNTKVFTISCWLKHQYNNGSHLDILHAYNGSASNRFQLMLQPSYELSFFSGGSSSRFAKSVSDGGTGYANFRDRSAWMHVVGVMNTTAGEEGQRCKIYINGVERSLVDASNGNVTGIPFNGNPGQVNAKVIHHIMGVANDNATDAGQSGGRAQLCDYFFVDGQALTAEVFGFFKDGDGYQSSGTTQATDFRSGQWSPRLPKSIKHEINRGGGFGVNGFYLPFNDSSNPGADFHCTPNTIVKLKGEDSPQPRSGAPTTSDAFVSQLREEKGSEDLPFEGVVKFGGFDTNSSLKFPDHSDLELGASPFTAECWVYPQDTSQSNFGALFNKGYGFQVYWKDDIEALQLFVSSDGSNYNMINGVATLNGSVPKGKWTHIAVVRESGNNTWKIYTNGKLTYGPLVVSGTVHNNGNHWGFGDYVPSPGAYEYKGFISDFRLVVGSAVYTAPFTPPTTRLTNITNTKLLCCQSSTSATEAAVAPTTGGTAGGANTFATKNEMTGSIVLAVPFISRLIGSNKITNGSFDIVSDGQDGYDNGNGTVDGWTNNANSSLSISGNALRITHLTSGSWQGGNAAYVMGSNFVVGKTYSLKYKIRSSGNGNYSQGVGARIQKGSSLHSSNTEYSRSSTSDPGTSWTTVQLSLIHI